MDKMYLWILALGGNLPSEEGSPEETLRAALKMLDGEGMRLVDSSRLYETPCFPPGAGPDYINAAALVESPLDAGALLDRLHEIEAAFGRARQQRWGMRTLDIDLIAGGAQVLPDQDTYAAWRDLDLDTQMKATPEQLILPHPRMHERAFVLVPVHDVAPDWIHPVFGQSVAEMLAALPESARKEVRPL
ncbi:2-amino-4-hydroxy-6-hydroxymethyldihydropteridine diphosphokinase [Shimia aestuarii]|uniref:2-amino-4-hydroxy-6- hydroxymethyldihydropteridine diphosphokinase n=1 Tax=Shimia aestuarii TaxID=254406 RepID=UPI001FB1F48E|nr:2-amino-4-hydroxy-6-hydroxymethyldihydropteridine diphosphokinase [Shimia aestuarii]